MDSWWPISANNRIEQFDASRKLVRTIGAFGTGPGEIIDPLDVDVDSHDQVYVQSDPRADVQVFDSEGDFLRSEATETGPYLEVGPDDTVYVVSNQAGPTIRVFASDGTWKATWDLHELIHFATDIAVTDSGRIFIGSSDNGGGTYAYETLLELDRTGRAVHLWPNGTEAIDANAAGTVLYATYSDQPPLLRALALPAH